MAVSKWPEVESKLVQIEAWARDGLTDADISSNLGISTVTLWKYKNEHANLSNALKQNKEIADITVVNKLYQLTQGYRYDEVVQERMPLHDANGNVTGYEMTETKRTTKEVLPNVTAQIFWLKNRQSEQWRDKRETETRVEVRVPMLEEIQGTFANARRLNGAEVVDIGIDGSE